VLDPGELAYRILSSHGFVQGAHVVSHAQIGEAMAVTGRFTDIYEPAGALAIAAALAAMEEAIRKDPGGTSVHVAHGSGINTTPQKVHYFASAAYKAGRLSGREASDLISRANLDSRRAYNPIEEYALALAAIKRAKSEEGFHRNGSRVVAGGW
jgi:hypothetical protein